MTDHLAGVRLTAALLIFITATAAAALVAIPVGLAARAVRALRG